MANPNDADSSWQPPPAISEVLPVTLQMLSTGFGVGVGCGVGVGFLSPINLSAVPVLGQAAQGISAGLGGVSTWLGAAGASARQAARGLGVPGLDAGAGCGVLAGYYFGAGVMVKPSVVDQVARATTQLAGRLSQSITQKLQPGQAAGAANSSSPGMTSGVPSTTTLQLPPQLQQLSSGGQPSSLTAAGGAPSPASPAAALVQGMMPTQGTQQQPAAAGLGQQPLQGGGPQQHLAGVQGLNAVQQQADPVMMRLLLQQQGEIAALKKQNRQLRAAVCKMDPKASVCRGLRRGEGGKGSSSGKRGGDSGSEDAWSDS